MDPFINYLQYANNLAKNISPTTITTPINIVLGNESCDLDSMVSALALAYLRYQENHLVLPLLNINFAEFPLRTENCYLLNKLGIDTKLLLFRKDVDLEEYHSKGLLRLSLVDHHILDKKDFELASSIVEIFDHRPIDSNFCFSKQVSTLIKPVGSCTTLVLSELFDYSKRSNIITNSLAVLLHSVIVFDTIAFSKEAGKVTHDDSMAAAKLVDQFKLSRDVKLVFEELWNAHNDVSHLTPGQLLNKDLKIVNGIPIPGLPMMVKEFLKLSGALQALKDFSKEKSSNVIIIMGLNVHESLVHRDISIYSYSEGDDIAATLVRFLESFPDMCLCKIALDVPNIVYFEQGNTKFSRKSILPVLKTALL